MKLSIVTSMYKSEPHVRDFHATFSRIAEAITPDFEIIFIDDGSPDRSAEIVAEIAKTDPRVKLAGLSRNCGQSVAMLAGLKKAGGDRVFTSDIDMEDPPELLAQAWGMMGDDPSIESVYGTMKERKGPFLQRILGSLFYAALNLLSRERIPPQVWSRLMSRKFLDALLAYPEVHLFWSGLFHIVGFKQVGVPITRTISGRTSYNTSKRVALAVDAIISFSDRPLYFIFVTGFMVSTASVGYGLFLIWRHFRGDIISGWTSIMVSLWFFGGIITFSIGLIGLYVGKIYMQVKQRPRFTIDKEL